MTTPIKKDCARCGCSHVHNGGIQEACECVISLILDNGGPELSGWYPDWRCIAQLASAYYNKEGNQYSGGNLHVVLDDTNVEDHNVIWAQGNCSAQGDRDGERLAFLLQLVPIADRAFISQVVGGKEGKPLPEDWKPEGVFV